MEGEVVNGVIGVELSFGDGGDAAMMDVEEGEVVNGKFSGRIGERDEKELEAKLRNVHLEAANDMNKDKNKNKNRRKKRKSKKANANPRSNVFDLDRFVNGVCKRLREKKSYLVYTAVGVLGASALSDLVKEVDAIEACGGQKTAEGNRYRTGGGILWNILKTRDANAFREIMKKGKEFEKQFRRPSVGPPTQHNIASQDAGPVTIKPIPNNPDDDPKMKTLAEGQSVLPTREIRRSVHDRIRVPVSYDDLPGEESPRDHL